ncbi:putative sulfate exporter family transporter [Gordonia sp. X0973]|uniref:YeiH family protein n=1 Tax=Gordonia sp. X0973 TaxID=2742602 RepID=UPI000F54B714|nr:putative sulfate exporter family transporter [Gordonia sp. X0973]QKT08834.1 putative sulfate exporter family transporter [Gordonia sp. X0973]
MAILERTRGQSNPAVLLHHESLPGIVFVALGAAVSFFAHRLVPGVGVLTWAVLLGAVAANVGAYPQVCRPGVQVATKRVLRIGVVLLGLSLSVGAVAHLGVPVIGLVVVTLVTTLGVTYYVGGRLRMGAPRRLLIATGFAICGGSAIAAMEETAGADEDDVATAIAMVTLCGTVLMVAMPLLHHPLGLSATQYGIWTGASVQEVGQVVGAASSAGAAAVGVAVVVKLTRVLMLGPVVAVVGMLQRRRPAETSAAVARPPIVPLFVVGFIVCVALRSIGAVPTSWLGPLGTVQNLALAAALFGMGTAVHLRSLMRSAGPAVVLAVFATLLVAGVALLGVYAVA